MNPPYPLSSLPPALLLHCSGPYPIPEPPTPCSTSVQGLPCSALALLFNTRGHLISLSSRSSGLWGQEKTASWHRRPDIGAGQWPVNIYLSKRKWKLFPDWTQHSSTSQPENQGEMRTVAAVTSMTFLLVVVFFIQGLIAQASLKLTL